MARFLSVDPLTADYPSWSPYPFAMDRPIDGVDLDGLEWESTVKAANDQLGREVSKWKAGAELIWKRSKETFWTVVSFTDVNDAAVIATSITRGDKAVNVDGTPADGWDKGAAVAGVFIPAVSGSAVKKAMKWFVEGTVRVFENGQEVRRAATWVDPGKFANRQQVKTVEKLLKQGGDIVMPDLETAKKSLETHLGDIWKAGEGGNRIGYRIENDAFDAAKTGSMNGHVGQHINYYDKEKGLKGTISIQKTPKE